MPHTSVKAHTRHTKNGTVHVRRHGRKVPLRERLAQMRSGVGRGELGNAGKGALVTGGMAGIALLHVMFELAWAAAVLVSVLLMVVIWTCTQLLGATSKGKTRKRRHRPKSLRLARRIRLHLFKRAQRRQRAGKGRWGQRVRHQFKARKRRTA